MGQGRALPSEDGLQAIISDLYRAALEPEHWHRALDGVADALASAVRSNWLRSRTDNRVVDVVSENMLTPEAVAAYVAHFGAMDPMPDSIGARGPDRVLDLPAIVDLPEFRRSEFYNDFWRIHGHDEFLGVRADLDDELYAAIAVQRPARLGAYDEQERCFFGRVFPHIRRATQIHLRLHRLEARAAGREELLDALTVGVLFLDDRGRVLRASAAAQAVLAAADGLAVERGCLVASRSTERRRLDALVGDALRTGTGNGLGTGGAMSVTRPSRREAYQLLVTPIRPAPSALVGQLRPAAAVFVTDPERKDDVRLGLLQRKWGLTPAEARLTVLLSRGMSLAEIARRTRVKAETARNQLKSVFAKTGVGRQAELVQLVLQTAPPVTHRPT